MTGKKDYLSSWLKTIQIQNILLSAGITLQIADATRSTGMSLIIAWLCITFLLKLKQTFPATTTQSSFAGYAVLLGLLLAQTGTLIRIEDETGFTQYFCIAAGMAAMACLSNRNRGRLIQWIGASAIPLAAFYLLQTLEVSPLNQNPISEAFTNINELRSVLQETVFAFLATTSFIAIRLSKGVSGRTTASCSLISGIMLCIIIDSRIALLAPLAAIILSYIISHFKRLKIINSSLKYIPLVVTFTGFAIYIYAIVIAPDIGQSLNSDRGRINVAACWLNSVFSGNNSFILGSGYDRSSIMRICTDANVGNTWANSSAGHAHNVFAHFIALHGMTGLISLCILALIYFTYLNRCIKNEIHLLEKANIKKSLIAYSWSEATTTMAIIMTLSAMTTTFYIYNHTLQILIGLALGMPIALEAGSHSRDNTLDTP